MGVAKVGRSPSSPEPAGVRGGLVQQQIYEHATRLFAQRGYAGTSLQDIADAVGLTRPALYHYVESKNELLAQLVSEITGMAALDVAAIAQRENLTAAARVHEIVRLMILRTGRDSERFQLLLRSDADLPEPVAAAYRDGRRAVLRSLTDLIEDGVRRGEFHTVTAEVAALGALGTINWVAWWYHPGSHLDLDAVSVELADMTVHALLAEAGRPASTTPADAMRSVRRELDRLEALLDEHLQGDGPQRAT